MNTQPQYLKELYAGICHDDWRNSTRAKFGSIQFPALRYLCYVIARCVVPRDNTSNMTSPDLAILAAAINCDKTYNIGALIARHLSTNKVRGSIYGGIIALIMLATAMLPPRKDDLELDFIRLNLAAMKSNHFITYDSTLENLQYRLLFSFDLDNPRFLRLQIGRAHV